MGNNRINEGLIRQVAHGCWKNGINLTEDQSRAMVLLIEKIFLPVVADFNEQEEINDYSCEDMTRYIMKKLPKFLA